MGPQPTSGPAHRIILMPARPRTSSRRRKGGRDPYWEAIRQQWPFIVMLYEQYADKKPVMLFDIQEQRIYAYPYRAYRAELSNRSQASLTRQYERALARGDVVVFVRDNEQRRLVSYSLPLDD